MRFGVAKTYREKTLASIHNCFFSMNIDESTSANLHRVLAMPVSYYSGDAKKVVEHLESINGNRVNTCCTV